MAPVINHLLSNYKALSSNPIAKKKKSETEVKIFLDKQKLGEIVTSQPAL
jgi:hypothetical protein